MSLDKNKSVQFPIRLLNKGEEVATLHLALKFLGFEVTQSEIDAQRFGKITRSQILEIQEKNRIKANGNVDEATANIINKWLEEKGFFQVAAPRLKNLRRLKMSLQELRDQDTDAAKLVRENLNADLKNAVLGQMNEPSEKLKEAIAALSLDYDKVENLSFEDMVQDYVLPELVKEDALQADLESAIDGAAILSNTTPVSKLLGLETDARDYPALASHMSRVRNVVLGGLSKLNQKEIDLIDDLDLSEANKETFDTLVRTKKIGNKGRVALEKVAAFSKLMDDDFIAVEALLAENVRDPRDLVVKDRKDWMAFSRSNKIERPEGQSLEESARLIDLNLQLTFRTAYSMERITRSADSKLLNKIDDVDVLLARNESIFNKNEAKFDLDLSDIANADRPKVEASLNALKQFSNRYAYLGIPEFLNDASLSPQTKRSRILKRQQALRKFHENNPDFELAWANFYAIDSETAQAFEPIWTGIADDDKEPVRKTLAAMQRVYRVTQTNDEMGALMAAGLDTAEAIRRLPVEELIAVTGLPEKGANRILTHAIDISTRSAHFMALLDESTNPSPVLPAAIYSAGNLPDLGIINILKDIDGYAELFGNQNYCRCEHCRSIFSPGAYFVDLMRFIENNISKRYFINPDKTDHALYLKNRRPDLWFLSLSCKNTETLIPYLTIVNEALVDYLERVFNETDIFEALTTTRSSFQQPFNLPFAELGLYLGHFGIRLQHVYELMDQEQSPETRIRGVLEASPEELSTIVSPDPEGILLRYGNPDNLSSLEVQSLLQRMGVSREELGRLVGLKFIRIDLLLNFDIESKQNDLIGFVENLRVTLDSDVVPIITVFEEIVRLFLDRLHRFVRLWRLLPWTPEEIDSLIEGVVRHDLLIPNLPFLSSTGRRHQLLGGELNTGLLTIIADMKMLQDSLDLSFSEIYALIIDLPLQGSQPGDESLFDVLFDGAASLTIKHQALENLDADENAMVSADFGVLQGGLRIDEAELLGLISAKLTPTTISDGVFNHTDISILYRYARLARSLTILPSELLKAELILSTTLESSTTADRIETIQLIQRFIVEARQSPFSVPEIFHLVTGNTEVVATQETLLTEIRDEIHSGKALTIRPEQILVDGLNLAGARRLFKQLSEGPEASESTANWLSQINTTNDIFMLNVEVGLNIDLDVLATAITAAELFMTEAPEVIASQTAIIAERFMEHHPVKLFKSALLSRLNTTHSYFDALRLFQAQSIDSPEGVNDLFQWMRDPVAPASEALISNLNELTQLLFVLQTKLNLPEESLRQITKRPKLYGLNLPLVWQWQGLHRLSLYGQRLRNNPEAMDDLHLLLRGWTENRFAADATEQVAAVLKVTPFDLGPLRERVVESGNPFDALLKLEEAAALVKILGLDGTSLAQLTANSFQGLTVAKNLVYGAIRGKYNAETWLKTKEPFEDALNKLKRDVLVDRILSRESQLRFSDTREIYQFFLLDVEMDGCARISRVKEAISACQLYMHRCLMSLEQSESGDVRIKVGLVAKAQWPWRKNYRVWEANRKVFLYPENYLEPNLRDNKSHMFKQAEEEVMQRPLNASGLESIFKDYLSEFNQLAQMVIVSAYYDPRTRTYFFFGRTRTKPYQYYFRKLIRKTHWTMWEPIDLTIEAKRINVIRHKGQLYLFWLSPMKSDEADRMVDRSPANDEDTADGSENTTALPLTVNYSVFDEGKTWTSPQSLIFYLKTSSPSDFSQRFFDDLFPESKNSIRLSHLVYNNSSGMKEVRGRLDLFNNAIFHGSTSTNVQASNTHSVWSTSNMRKYRISGLKVRAHLNKELPFLNERFLFLEPTSAYFSEAAAQYHLRRNLLNSASKVATFSDQATYDLRIVNGRVKDLIFQFKDQFLLLQRTTKEGWPKQTVNLLEVLAAMANSKHRSILLSTSVATTLSKKLFNRGLDKFLSLETQKIKEKPVWQRGLKYEWLGELAPPIEGGNILAQSTHLDFKGAHGGYFREIFFHLPFLIAYYLNGKQKYADADYWYRKIFDPSAQAPAGKNPSKKDKWQYMEFRSQDLPKLRDILTDEAAIDVYQKDPFNPFAIARLRPSAFQKATVMRYIDNLLDWGDHLFSQDTFESINEATMLYVMAADVLGDRPVEVGDCDRVGESSLTFDQITRQDAVRSDFLIELENIVYYLTYIPNLAGLLKTPKDLGEMLPGVVLPDDGPTRVAPSSGFAMLRQNTNASFAKASELATVFSTTATETRPVTAVNNLAFEIEEDDPSFDPADDFALEFEPPGPLPPVSFGVYHAAVIDPWTTPEPQKKFAFCVPPNETLLAYWDRVDDRLFKIRHCMNIKGVRRQLPLFQPPIDPMLLVRAKAAGLSLDDILGQLNAEMPSYRFRTLLEKARQFTATVQQFGAQVQAALERKDSEALILLQAAQQDEINEAVRQVKLDNQREAIQSRLSLEAARFNTFNRRHYYFSLLTNVKDTELATNAEEENQAEKLDEGQGKRKDAANDEKYAAAMNLAPSWSANVSLGSRYPKPLFYVDVSAQVSYGSANLAALFTNRGRKDRNAAASRDFDASQSALRSSQIRRKAEWQQQKAQADGELQQLDKQIAAAEIREEIAEKELSLHKEQTEHARELFDFYKDKFTNLGLYTYLSSSLARLHREAYNLAHDMSLKAQRAYQFEVDDPRFLIKNDNWDNSKAGLLSGDRLLLQLHEMDKQYLEQNRRQYEVTLPCSLVQINARALLQFQQTGSCEFSLPEDWFDLYYPGQYRRRIKSIRLSIPCITGPYVNVSAKLTLTGSQLRLEPNADATSLVFVPAQRNTSIATSTATADAGLFELNFNDERYLPFEGAGAMSTWRLELPGAMRAFDYNSISDVIMHVSYTAKDDGLYRETVESNLSQRFQDLVQSQDLLRIVSLKHEFPSVFHRLMQAQEGQESTTNIRLNKRHFPFFLREEVISLDSVRLILEGSANNPLTSNDLLSLNQDLSMQINGDDLSGWAFDGELELPVSVPLSLNSLEITDEGVDLVISMNGNEIPDLADIWMQFEYRLSS